MFIYHPHYHAELNGLYVAAGTIYLFLIKHINPSNEAKETAWGMFMATTIALHFASCLIIQSPSGDISLHQKKFQRDSGGFRLVCGR
jgi:hypothetical protein